MWKRKENNPRQVKRDSDNYGQQHFQESAMQQNV
jgi:hypothetical protein